MTSWPCVVALIVAGCASQPAPHGASAPRMSSRPSAEAQIARRNRLILALEVAGAGVLAIGVGAKAGLDAREARDEARTLGCTEDLSTCPSGAALDTANHAYERAKFATGFFIGGGLVVGAALAIWLTAPRADAKPLSWRVTPSAAPSGGGVVMSRGF